MMLWSPVKKQKEIKLIVLDIMMPIGDDFNESAKQEAEFGLNTGVYFYKKYLKDKNIPVILFTHLSDLKLPEKVTIKFICLKNLIIYRMNLSKK
ncbi:hypothetical protein BH720_021685 [Desertifilum tharense IPPAS B-1220]|uniref:Uncharacterized protein n=1 Tax=Desertifilum tharense IPPAS B-1220 TaxID=1781255 RepID=A0ACD5GS02_9CYAN